jgi:hypothetical protein
MLMTSVEHTAALKNLVFTLSAVVRQLFDRAVLRQRQQVRAFLVRHGLSHETPALRHALHLDCKNLASVLPTLAEGIPFTAREAPLTA